MNLKGRFKCPACVDGLVWRNGYYDESFIFQGGWKAFVCEICEGHRFILTDEKGRITGPDAPRRYLCDHGERLTDPCVKCGRVPHGAENGAPVR